MKYFSPSLLDGSVTSAKLAMGAVTRAKLSTDTNSQAGAIGTEDLVTIVLDPYSLAPGIEANASGGKSKDVVVVATRDVSPGPDPLAPTFDLRNLSTSGAASYAVAWLHIDV